MNENFSHTWGQLQSDHPTGAKDQHWGTKFSHPPNLGASQSFHSLHPTANAGRQDFQGSALGLLNWKPPDIRSQRAVGAPPTQDWRETEDYTTQNS